MNTNWQTIRLYWQQIRKHKVSFFAMLIFIPTASVLLNILLPYFLTQAIGTFADNDSDSLNQFLIISSGVVVIGLIFNIIGFQSAIYNESRVRNLLVKSTLDKILTKDNSFFANQKIGALTGKFIDFINAHVGLQDLFIIQTLTFVINMTIGITLIAMNSWLIGLIIIGLMVILFVQINLSIKLRKPLRIERKEMIGKVNGSLADTITNNLTVKTFANENFELKQTAKLTDRYQKVYQKDFGWLTFEGSIRLLVMSTVQIISVAVIASLLFNGQIDLGIAIFVVAYLQRIATQLFDLGVIINGYDKLLLQAAPLTEILSENPTVVDAPNAKELKVTNGKIQLVNVDYAYRDDMNTNVISNLNLTVPAGQRVGLVGTSGAGKTTLTKILLRFDDVKNGQVLIDGQDIAKVTQESLRSNISYVSQEPLLFHRSLRENIAYGRLDASNEEINQAIKSAHALEFIDKLPKGLDTVVGERGVKLSGGQRQRIAIARAILKDAPILVLDEATSALDSTSERLIQASLENLMEGRTSLVIAHRLSTIAKLDRIIVMEDGGIIEDGSHQELLDKGGKYASLWRHQSGGFLQE